MAKKNWVALCGDESHRSSACILTKGHVGMHNDGHGFKWQEYDIEDYMVDIAFSAEYPRCWLVKQEIYL